MYACTSQTININEVDVFFAQNRSYGPASFARASLVVVKHISSCYAFFLNDPVIAIQVNRHKMTQILSLSSFLADKAAKNHDLPLVIKNKGVRS